MRAKALAASFIAASVCVGAIILSPASYHKTFKNASSNSDPEISAVTTALQATGIASATVEHVPEGTEKTDNVTNAVKWINQNVLKTTPATSESNSDVQDASDCYVMFSVNNSLGSDAASSTGGEGLSDTILARIEPDGRVSIISFERDVSSTVSINEEARQNIESAYESGNREALRQALQQIADIHIDYYASVDSRYLYELKANLKELSDSGQEWQAYVQAKAEAERLAAEEAARPKTVIDDQLWFNQNDFTGQYYQDYFDIPSYGCGLCSTTVALDMLFGQNWTPVDVAQRMEDYADSHGGIQYCVWAGTSYPQWEEVVEGEFGVDIRRAESTEDAKDALEDGKMIFAGNGGYVFKDSSLNKHWHDGHIICFYKTDGSSVWAKDPAGCGGASVEYTSDDFQQWWDWGGSNRMYIISRAGE